MARLMCPHYSFHGRFRDPLLPPWVQRCKPARAGESTANYAIGGMPRKEYGKTPKLGDSTVRPVGLAYKRKVDVSYSPLLAVTAPGDSELLGTGARTHALAAARQLVR